MSVLKVLGSVELVGSDGEAVLSVLSQPKRTALLAYLALARPRGFHRRDKLLALFWPEQDSEHARAALSSSLSFLRRSLGEDVILTRGNEEVGINASVLQTDAVTFENAVEAQDPEAALEEYRGHLLEGFFLSGCPEFEHWLDEERERLRELAAGAAWDLAHRQLAAGELVAAERAAQKALRWVPTDESPVRAFIEALAGAGDRAAAVRFYEKFAQVLQEELELEPSAETRAIASEIRAGRVVERADHVALRVVPAGHPQAAMARRQNLWIRRALRALVGVVVLAVAAVLSSWPWGDSNPAVERVAVLPFENHTGDPSLGPYGSWAADYITSGLADAQLTQVVTSEDLASVANQTAADGATSADLSLTWAQRLGATLAVRGAYYLCPPGDSIEFRLEIVEPDGAVRGMVPPIRGATEDPTEGLGRLQVQVVGKLADIVVPGHQLALTARGRSPPKLEAHQTLIEGWTIFATGSWEASIPILERALELDTLYFKPLRLLYSAYLNLGRAAEMGSVCQRMEERIHLADRGARLSAERVCPTVRTEGRTKVEIARDLAELNGGVGVYLLALDLIDANRPREAIQNFAKFDTAQGSIHRNWEWVNAYLWAVSLHALEDHSTELNLVRDARARFPDQHRLINQELAALVALERHGEARRLIEDQLAFGAPGQTPADLLMNAGREFDAHGSPGVARELWERALEWLEGRPPEELETGPNRRTRVWNLLFLERLEEADSLLVELMTEFPDNLHNHRLLGILEAKLGDREAAEGIAEALAAWDQPVMDGGNTFWRARIAAQLGDMEKAVSLLERAMEEGWQVRERPHRDPFLKPLRGHPAFEEFKRPKG